jgi:hypothetical protein
MPPARHLSSRWCKLVTCCHLQQSNTNEQPTHTYSTQYIHTFENYTVTYTNTPCVLHNYHVTHINPPSCQIIQIQTQSVRRHRSCVFGGSTIRSTRQTKAMASDSPQCVSVQQAPTSLVSCPTDVLYYTCEMLDGRSVLALTRSCRQLHASMVHSSAEHVWRKLLVELIDGGPITQEVTRAAVLNPQPDSELLSQFPEIRSARSWRRRYIRAIRGEVLVIVNLVPSAANRRKGNAPLCLTLRRDCSFFGLKRALRNAQLLRDRVYLEDFELVCNASNQPLGVRGNDSLPPADLSRLFFDIQRGNGDAGGGLPSIIEALVPRRVRRLMRRRRGHMVRS